MFYMIRFDTIHLLSYSVALYMWVFLLLLSFC